MLGPTKDDVDDKGGVAVAHPKAQHRALTARLRPSACLPWSMDFGHHVDPRRTLRPVDARPLQGHWSAWWQDPRHRHRRNVGHVSSAPFDPRDSALERASESSSEPRHLNSPVSEGEPFAGFAERLLAVIDEGRRTATYKLALLTALMDCCAEAVSPGGLAPAELGTRSIARRVAAIYWPQLRPFPALGSPLELRQITNKSAVVIRALRTAFQALPSVATWEAAESALPEDHVAQVLDVVELTVARYPLVRLQTLDGVQQPFLYDINWGEDVTLARLHAGAGAVVRLRPGAGDQLIRLAPLVRPLVQLHWVRMVASLNDLSLMEEDLYRHLFGAERVGFPPCLRSGLRDLQEGACFYCAEPLAATAVDHFLPWSRWPNDAVENLVIAHPSCNSRKSDRVPGPRALTRWADRMREHGGDLVTLASQASWRSDPPRTASLARSLYAHLPEGTPLWEGPQLVTPARRSELMDLLSAL